ncbi:MAG TPA: class I SAM-dependent methyltransferase, partial [Anaeromyxobacteraceae bacterium]
MTDELNPQARQMADESMVRNLAAQAEAIWPQEAPLFRRYALPEDARILDAGCGPGEATSRLAELFPRATVLGVDILDVHLEIARLRLRGEVAHHRLVGHLPRLRVELVGHG